MKRARTVPGSVWHSVVVLAATGCAAILLIALTDGLPAAGAGLALLAAAGLAVARYAVGGGAQDSGLRRPVRLMGSREPALGQWESIVATALGPDSELYFAVTMRVQLQRLFAARLAERHGVDMYRAPLRARALVGPDLWPWIDPGAPPPAAPLTAPVLSALLDRLEAPDSAARPAARGHSTAPSDTAAGNGGPAQ